MEGLHVSIEDAIVSGIFTPVFIRKDDVGLSHLLYADDAIFMGEWSRRNVENLVTILNCFYLASVDLLARVVGCSSAKVPFLYLGLPVGENMSRANGLWYLYSGVHCSPWARVVGAVSKLHSKGVVNHNALRRKLGDGKQIHFWSDCWLGRLPLKIEYPRLAALEEDVDCRVADRWSSGGWRWHWRRHITGGVTAAQLEELNHRLLEVKCVDERDTWVWDLADDGLFSVAVTRNWIDDKVLPVGGGGHNTRWSKIVPRKVNIFIWRLLWKRLPTRELLTKRGIFIHTVACPMCGLEDETLMHVCGRCEVVEVLWRRVFSWMGISPMQVGNPHSMFEWVDNYSVNGNKKKVMETIVCAVYWYVWRYRNDVVHESGQIRKSELFDFIREVSYVWFSNRQKKVGANWINWLQDPLNNPSYRISGKRYFTPLLPSTDRNQAPPRLSNNEIRRDLPVDLAEGVLRALCLQALGLGMQTGRGFPATRGDPTLTGRGLPALTGRVKGSLPFISFKNFLVLILNWRNRGVRADYPSFVYSVHGSSSNDNLKYCEDVRTAGSLWIGKIDG
ncbi:hypothetical protein LXL04_019084 [Taraxacum kok-saghyz]